MNEILFIITILLTFGGLLVVYKLFGKVGLFSWIAIAIILANIEVLKSVNIFGISATLGNVTFASIFLANEILNEKYGRKEARKGVLIGLASIVVFIGITQLDLLFVPNASDFVSPSMNTIFSIAPRIALSSIVMYLISNLVDARIYSYLLKKYPKRLMLRSNAATIFAQVSENILFVIFAFWGIFDTNIILEIIITTSVLEIIIALFDTPFLYIANKLKVKE